MSNSSDLELREDTIVITLNDVMDDFSEPEHLRLKLASTVRKKPLDVGSWAYFIRGKNRNIHDARGNPVVLKSFVESRRKVISKILPYFFGLRDSTVLTRIGYIDYFIDWLNVNDYREIFSSESDAQRAYRDYTAYLNYQVSNKVWKRQSAHAFQSGAIWLIDKLYPEHSHYILAGAVKILEERGSAAPSSAHVDLYLDVCLAIARECSDFVRNSRPYPCVVKIRDYEVVIFPSVVGAVGPFRKAPLSYNAAERRIATADEYCATREDLGLKPGKRSEAAANLRQTLSLFQIANEEARHWHRFELASLATKAYATIFMMITGATPTEFSQFSYSDAIEVVKSPLKKELSAVKFRAAGKSTLYNIGRETGLPLLKDYLKLREWILDGKENAFLFFDMPPKFRRKQKNDFFSEAVFDYVDAANRFYNSISGVFIDPVVPRLSARKMRKYKSNGMHMSGIALSSVATALNHSEAMNFSTYAEAVPETLEAEFGNFWQSIRQAAHVVRERSLMVNGNEIPISVGHCNEFDNPAPSRNAGPVAIEPNCRIQYGCLYCEHYLCHSDEEDLHKLLSLYYVINAVRKAAPDTVHAEKLYEELSFRIEFILDELSDRSNATRKTLKQLKSKVFEYGELTPFWEARLSRYEKIGVVF